MSKIQTSLYLTDQTLSELQAAANETGKTRNAVITEIIESWIKRRRAVVRARAGEAGVGPTAVPHLRRD